MKKFLLGVTSAAFLAAPAVAADIPVKAAPPVVVVWSWTGCYIGGHGGWQRSRVDAEYGANSLAQVPGTPLSEDLRLNGLTLGATVGCNYQFAGNWVVGVEADYDFISKQDTRVETAFPAFRVRVDQDGFGTLRGRIGYAFDRGLIIPLPTLWYVTGGGAWARMETSNFIPSTAVGVSQKENYTGWTVGYGSEYSLGSGWTVKSETLYARMKSETNFAFNTPVALAEFNIGPRSIWISRIGLNYKFNMGGPVVARY